MTEFMIDSPELVDLVRPTAGPAQSWAVTTPIMLRSKDTGQPLGPVYVNCVYDRGAGQTLVHLQPGA